MRAAHSLKGAARIVGLDAAVRVAHALEDNFVAAQRGEFAIKSSDVDVLLKAVDLLARSRCSRGARAASWQAENEGMIAATVAGTWSGSDRSRRAGDQRHSPSGKPEPPPCRGGAGAEDAAMSRTGPMAPDATHSTERSTPTPALSRVGEGGRIADRADSGGPKGRPGVSSSTTTPRRRRGGLPCEPRPGGWSGSRRRACRG